MAGKIKLKIEHFNFVVELEGITSKSDLADLIGVDQSTLHRIITGSCAPGTAFICGVLCAFGPIVRFEHLFECIDTDGNVITVADAA